MKKRVYRKICCVSPKASACAVLLALAASCAIAQESPPPGEGWVSLFNGRDLTGWIVPPLHPGDPEYMTPTWKVADGAIDCSGGGRTLITDREYGDYVLRLQWRWKFDPNATKTREVPLNHPDGSPKLDEAGQPMMESAYVLDSGIFVRGEPVDVYINKPKGHLNSGPSQVNLWARSSGSGSVFGARPRENGVPRVKADRDPGQWNDMQITVVGKKISVVLNGISIAEDVEVAPMPDRGPIHLQAHGSGSKIQFRDLWIKELPARTAAPGAAKSQK